MRGQTPPGEQMPKILTIVTSAYKAEKYLELYFQNILSLEGRDQFQVIVVLNDATPAERKIADAYQNRFPGTFRLVYTPRETIGASTNRGYTMADSPYVVYADVDDLRSRDAYIRQIKTLDNNPDVDFTYGDFLDVKKIGDTTGKRVVTADFDRLSFTRGSMVGPNHFFRRQLLEKVGFWDEQLRSGGDFEFQVRAAFNCQFKKTEGILVYKLNATQSASQGILQPLERTVIELRYGIYDKIDYNYLPDAVRYNITYIGHNGTWQTIRSFVPGYDELLEQRRREWFPKGMTRYYWQLEGEKSLLRNLMRRQKKQEKRYWRN